MSSTQRLATASSFFLAGVMQGSRPGAQIADQNYRDQLRDTLLAWNPDAEIRDPHLLMAGWLGEREGELRAAYGRLAMAPVVERATAEPAVRTVTEVFDRLVYLSADSDVCVAWLPGQEASMGTAAEMWAAHAAGKFVVAITPMRQNLAVLACSDVVVPDLAAFDALMRAVTPLVPVGAGAAAGGHDG